MDDVTGNPGNEVPLERIATSAQRGDAAARQELAARVQDDLRAYVRIRSSPELRLYESCSDLVQSVCREVFEDLSGWEDRGAGSFKAWLFTVALNKVRQKYGRLHAQKRDPARELRGDTVGAGLYGSICALDPSPSELAVGAEEAMRIEAAMDRLPEDHREVILQKRLMGLDHRQIAERMGRSEGAVRVLLSRALVRLLAELEGRGAAPEPPPGPPPLQS